MADRTWASARIARPGMREGSSWEAPAVDLPFVVYQHRASQGRSAGIDDIRTLDCASAIAAMMIPTVSMATLRTCIGV